MINSLSIRTNSILFRNVNEVFNARRYGINVEASSYRNGVININIPSGTWGEVPLNIV